MKSKDVKGIRRYIENYLSTDEAKEIINHHKSIKDGIKFAVTKSQNEDYTLITAVEPFLVNNNIAKLLSKEFNCLCLYISYEEVMWFAIELFDHGESISRVSSEEVVIESGIDENGIPFADTEDMFISDKFDLDVFCKSLKIDDSKKREICKMIEDESLMIIDYIGEILDLSVFEDIEYILDEYDDEYLQKNQCEFIS